MWDTTNEENFLENIILTYRKWFELEEAWEIEKAEILYKIPANVALKNKDIFEDPYLYYLWILGFPLLSIRKLWETKNSEALDLLNEYINLLYNIERTRNDEFILECVKGNIQIIEWIIRAIWKIEDRQYDAVLLEQYHTYHKMLIDTIESKNKMKKLGNKNI